MYQTCVYYETVINIQHKWDHKCPTLMNSLFSTLRFSIKKNNREESKKQKTDDETKFCFDNEKSNVNSKIHCNIKWKINELE